MHRVGAGLRASGLSCASGLRLNTRLGRRRLYHQERWRWLSYEGATPLAPTKPSSSWSLAPMGLLDVSTFSAAVSALTRLPPLPGARRHRARRRWDAEDWLGSVGRALLRSGLCEAPPQTRTVRRPCWPLLDLGVGVREMGRSPDAAFGVPGDAPCVGDNTSRRCTCSWYTCRARSERLGRIRSVATGGRGVAHRSRR